MCRLNPGRRGSDSYILFVGPHDPVFRAWAVLDAELQACGQDLDVLEAQDPSTPVSEETFQMAIGLNRRLTALIDKFSRGGADLMPERAIYLARSDDGAEALELAMTLPQVMLVPFPVHKFRVS